VQLRTPKTVSKGGIILPKESTETEIWNTQVARVHSLGPVAFHHRDTLEPWPEGLWCKKGEFVRIPKYGGDRWWVPVSDPNSKEVALFILVKDLDIAGEVEDPLDCISYVD
jgi:co-chaperonin GroES (HSP10)